MALIICPECGKEISDQAVACPNCGYPIEAKVETVRVVCKWMNHTAMELNNDTLTVNNSIGELLIRDDISNFYLLYLGEPNMLGYKVVTISHRMLDKPITFPFKGKEEANYEYVINVLKEKAIVKLHRSKFLASVYVVPKTSQEYREDKIRRKEEKNMVRCPKCGSTSITYDNKKLSVGRGLVGGLVGGAAGGAVGEAVGITLGGLSSKKGYCICMSCGKRWKI